MYCAATETFGQPESPFTSPATSLSADSKKTRSPSAERLRSWEVGNGGDAVRRGDLGELGRPGRGGAGRVAADAGEAVADLVAVELGAGARVEGHLVQHAPLAFVVVAGQPALGAEEKGFPVGAHPGAPAIAVRMPVGGVGFIAEVAGFADLKPGDEGDLAPVDHVEVAFAAEGIFFGFNPESLAAAVPRFGCFGAGAVFDRVFGEHTVGGEVGVFAVLGGAEEADHFGAVRIGAVGGEVGDIAAFGVVAVEVVARAGWGRDFGRVG